MPANYTLLTSTSNRKKFYKPDPSKFLFNVDTLWYTYDAFNYDEVMQSGLIDRLVDGREVALDAEGADYIEVDMSRYERPVNFEIQSRGQAPIYSFQIRNEDMAFYFAKRRRNDGTFPVKVQINQFKLWELGVKDAFLESLEVLEKLGFHHESSKPNRIDLCVHSDQFQWNLLDLRDMDYPRNVADDNKPTFYKLDPSTFEFETVYYGDRSRLQMRLYNKSIEITKKGKDYFREIYEQHDMDAERVWNLEFEVHRDYLKSFACEETGETGIFDTMDFLLRIDGLSLLWTHLVKDRFTHDSAFWKQVQSGDPQKFVETNGHIFRLKDIDLSKQREVSQIRGRLMKMVLAEQHEPDADLFVEAMKTFQMLMIDYEKEKERDFAEDVREKRRQYMDVDLLKKGMADLEKSTDKLAMFSDLMTRKEASNRITQEDWEERVKNTKYADDQLEMFRSINTHERKKSPVMGTSD